jgi:hypothetical protein
MIGVKEDYLQSRPLEEVGRNRIEAGTKHSMLHRLRLAGRIRQPHPSRFTSAAKNSTSASVSAPLLPKYSFEDQPRHAPAEQEHSRTQRFVGE